MDNSNLVEVKNIHKRFGGVQALTNVEFILKSGEIHALLGENGAGKSTLIKIICGAFTKDSGQIIIKDKEVKHLNPTLARKMGISTVFQELSLVDELTVEENIFLGKEPLKKLPIINRNERSVKAREILDYVGSNVGTKTKVKNLGAAQQQLVEIAKALSTNPEIIIMDEPTDKLYGKEQEQLFKLLKKLRNDGKGIIYISHKIEELPIIADRVTVLRDGYNINTYNINETTQDELINNMVGRELKDMFPKEEAFTDEEVFRVEDLSYGSFLEDINFNVRKGEIVGIGGLVGSGRTLLAQNLAGILKPTCGKMFLEGKEINANTPNKAISQGIVLMPEDRKASGLIMLMSVFNNIVLPSLKKFVLRKKELKKGSSRLIKSLRIKTPDEKTIVNNLSGGNQQKVVIAKWLFMKVKLFIFDEPTQGIDVGTKAEIYKLMNNLVKEGASIIMISSDMMELISMSDRVIVMRKGRISAILNKEECTQENILGKALLKN